MLYAGHYQDLFSIMPTQKKMQIDDRIACESTILHHELYLLL